MEVVMSRDSESVVGEVIDSDHDQLVLDCYTT